MPAATAAAQPLEEPPGARSRSHGLRVARKAEFSPDEPMANSSMCAMPSGTQPASSARVTKVAVYAGR